MKPSFFLHYGPGGNAYVESQKLNSILPNAIFWDQSKAKDSQTPFQSLVKATADEIKKNTSPVNLVAHSFGCDLVAGFLPGGDALFDKIILISPLRSIPQAMLNLAKNLLAKKNEPALETAYKAANLNSAEKMDATLFWNLVSNIVIHPFYGSAFWTSANEQKNYENIAANGPAFDGQEWQTLMQDYLFQNNINDFKKLKGKDVLVIFGETDPYLDLAIDIPFWQQIVGNHNVITIKQTGHFLHIEQLSQFNKIIKSFI